MNKKAGFTDLFLFMVIAFIIIIACGVFIYIGITTEDKLHEKLDGKMFGDTNATQVIDDNFGAVNTAYHSLYWISVLLIVGMVISTFIGNYLVTTKPVFFIPYILVVIIAGFVSVGISNAYESVIADPTLANTFAGFVGANFIMANLPIWVVAIGIIGGVLMFSRLGSKEQSGGYYG